MDAYDGWMAGNALRDALILTFRRRFLRTTRTPLTDICMVTLRFFRFCTLHSYCEERERKKGDVSMRDNDINVTGEENSLEFSINIWLPLTFVSNGKT